MGRKAKFEIETGKEPVKKFDKEQRQKVAERKRRKSRRAILGAYVERTLGSDTTPENFFRKAQSWVERQKLLQRARKRAAKLNGDEFYPPPHYEFKNPLAKYAFDNGAMY